jgi:hypothetical protein
MWLRAVPVIGPFVLKVTLLPTAIDWLVVSKTYR